MIIGFFSAQYTWQSGMLAAGMTVAIFVGMTIFACATEGDFTGQGPYLVGLCLALVVFGIAISIMGICGVNIVWLNTVYAWFGVILFTLYIVYDTQLIIGEYGGHKTQFEVDEYAFAALSLYLDVVSLFVQLLQVSGDRK